MNGVLAIVDDDRHVLAGLGRLARSLGYETRLFPGADEFLAHCADEELLCALIDLQMPGMGGIELMELLAERLPALPVIAMTAFPNEANRQRTLRAGATAFLQKPFDVDQLDDYLKEIASRLNG